MPRSGSKKSGYLNIPARLLLKERDNLTGSYPTLLRMGDKDRKGTYNNNFNDTNTIIFGKKILDNFELRDDIKFNNIMEYSKIINSNLWIHSNGMEIRKETFIKAGGGTALDGALVFAGLSDRWIQTKDKIKNPNINIDVIVGPYNQKRGLLGLGLGLTNPSQSLLKVQVSKNGSAWTTIKEIKNNSDDLFSISNFVRRSEFEEFFRKRKRITIKIGLQDFSSMGGDDFYFRIIEEAASIENLSASSWAIGKIIIDYYNENVNYPLMINTSTSVGQKILSNSVGLPHTAPTLFGQGRTISGISDVYLKFTPGENITSFEDSRINIKPGNQFFDQGTEPNENLNFSSPLWSKTQIVINLSTAEETTFGLDTPSTSGSPEDETDDKIKQKLMVYWNKDLRRWEKIAQGVSGNAPTGSLENMISSGALGFSGIDLVSSGATNNYVDQNILSSNVLNSYVRPTTTFGFPFEGKYHATSSQFIKASDLGITKPFLLEKCQIIFDSKFEFPENGDSAERAYSLIYGYPNGGNPSFRNDSPTANVWIPTFFMLRQQDFDFFTKNIQYETDVTGSIFDNNRSITIPDLAILGNDNDEFLQIESSRELITYGQITFYTSGSTASSNFNIREALDNGLSRDAEVDILLLNGQRSTYDGSNDIDPLTGSFEINFPCRTTSKVFGGSRMRLINSDGENTGLWLDNKIGGRSYSELEGSSRTLINGISTLENVESYQTFATNPLNNPLTINCPSAQSMDLYSPYIIMPEDNIIFGWQYPITNKILFRSPGSGSPKFNSMTLFGNSKLTLFGSQIKDDKEFHETINQNLTSDTIHEIIGNNAVLDEFQNAKSIENYGNYLDSYIVNNSKNPIERINSPVQSRLITEKGNSSSASATIKISSVAPTLSPGVDDGDIITITDYSGEQGHFFLFNTYQFTTDDVGMLITSAYDSDNNEVTDVSGGSRLAWPAFTLTPYKNFGSSSSVYGWTIDNVPSNASIDWSGILQSSAYTGTGKTLTNKCWSVKLVGDANNFNDAYDTLNNLKKAIIASSLDVTVSLNSYNSGGLSWFVNLIITQNGTGAVGNKTNYHIKNSVYQSGAGASLTDSYNSMSVSNFSGGNNLIEASLGSFVKIINTQDAERIYNDSLLSSKLIDSPFGPASSFTSYGTYQTNGNEIRPKYYLNTRRFGQKSDLMEQGRDSKTKQSLDIKKFGLDNSVKGNALSSPVEIIFVSGSVSDDIKIKSFTKTNNPQLSINLSINSVLTGAFYEE